MYRIREIRCAQKLLDAVNFNMDEVTTRCSLYSTSDHVFVADVMYHAPCLCTCLRKYEKRLEALSAHVEICNLNAKVDKHCLNVFQSLNFKFVSHTSGIR